jgi:predicted nucleic acid-binding protein
MILPAVNTLLYAVNSSSDQHAEILGRLLKSAGTAGNLTTDAHLAALAIEHGATILTFDRNFARFEGVQWTLPAAD